MVSTITAAVDLCARCQVYAVVLPVGAYGRVLSTMSYAGAVAGLMLCAVSSLPRGEQVMPF